MDRALRPLHRRIVTLAAAALAGVAGLTGIREFDQWFHMAWGRSFLRQGPGSHDYFLFTFQDVPFSGSVEWLGSIGIFIAWWLGGEAGTVLLVGLLVGLTAWILVWDGTDGEDRRWVDLAIAVVVTFLAVGVIRRRAVVRPEIFCYPLLAWTIFAARRWVQGRGRSILIFPLAALLWANVHATVVYGLGAVVAIAAEAWVRGWLAGPAAPERRRGLILAGVGAAGMALAFVHPFGSPVMLAVRYGLDALGFHAGPAIDPVSQQGLDLAHATIYELQPPGAEAFRTALGGLIALSVIGFAVVGRRVRLSELFLTAVALLFALRAQRFLPLYAIIAAPIAARNLGHGAARLRGRWRAALWAVAPMVPAAAVWPVLFDPFPLSISRAPEIFPRHAAEVLASAGAHDIPGLRVYETFHFGGYLEWMLDAPVIYNDGRLAWPPGDAEVAIQATGAHAIGRLDARWRFDALVLDSLRMDVNAARLDLQRLTRDLMADQEKFALVAIDDGALLYVRRDGKLAKLLPREYRFVVPSRIVTAAELQDPVFVAGYRREMERAVAENPSCLYCSTGLFFARLASGDPEGAERIFPGGRPPETTHPLGNGSIDALKQSMLALGRLRGEEGLKYAGAGDAATAERLLWTSSLAADSAVVLAVLGRTRAGRGELVRAEADYRRAIELEPRLLEARVDLGRLLEFTGRLDDARDVYEACRRSAPQSREGRYAQQRLDALRRVGR